MYPLWLPTNLCDGAGGHGAVALAGFPLDTAAQLAWGGSVCLTVPLSSPLSSKWDPMVASCSPCLPSCPDPWSCEYLPLSPFIVGLAPWDSTVNEAARKESWLGWRRAVTIYIHVFLGLPSVSFPYVPGTAGEASPSLKELPCNRSARGLEHAARFP